MKVFLIATLFVLASCATNTGTPGLDYRLASWVGSSVSDLEKVLGEPTTIEDDMREWKITAPGMASATSTYSPTGPLGAHFAKRDHGMPGKTSPDTSIQPKECVYRAVIDKESIIRIETVAVSGRCRFDEIPTKAEI